MTRTAIAGAEITAILRDVQQALIALRDAEQRESRMEKNLGTARELTRRRRLELGQQLVRARPLWPQRGPKAKGWGEFLAKLGIDQDVALDAMKYAGFVEEFPGTSPDVPGNLPTLAEAGIDQRPRLSLVPMPDEPRSSEDRDALDAAVAELPPTPDGEVDRDTWCTPKWIAEAVGRFDLDPCTNERAHIRAKHTFRLDRGENGLELAREVPANWRVWINPPYSDVMPWVKAYGHTRFAFLLKFDPSTKWFEALYKKTQTILIPSGTRVQFEPPPGVPRDQAQANPFPHALFYARAEDATAAIAKLCLDPWRLRSK